MKVMYKHEDNESGVKGLWGFYGICCGRERKSESARKIQSLRRIVVIR